MQEQRKQGFAGDADGKIPQMRAFAKTADTRGNCARLCGSFLFLCPELALLTKNGGGFCVLCNKVYKDCLFLTVKTVQFDRNKKSFAYKMRLSEKETQDDFGRKGGRKDEDAMSQSLSTVI